MIKVIKKFWILTMLVTLLSACTGTYTVKQGDSLAEIANEHDTTTRALIEANKDEHPSLAQNPDVIRVGWELEVPGHSPVELELPEGGDSKASGSPQGNSSGNTGNASAPTPSQGEQQEASTGQTIEERAIELINEEREERDLHPLTVDPALMKVAQKRAEQTAAWDGSGNPHHDADGNSLMPQVAAEYGLNPSRWGENLGWGAHTPEAAVTGWMNSDAHRAILLRSYFNSVGVGFSNGAWAFCATD